MSEQTTPSPWGARLPLTVGIVTIVLLVGGIGSWSVGTQIAGAVVASGTIKVKSDRQIVQHPDGGVVGKIEARDGDVVQCGDILVRFDDTYLKSELAITDQQLMEIYARKVRLEGERDGSTDLIFARASDFAQLDQAWVGDQVDGQANLFQARLDSLAQEQAQLAEQRLQIESQIGGIDSQVVALNRQLELIELELVDQQALREKGLVPVARILELQREQARLEGEVGGLLASMAESRGRVAEIEIQILNLESSRQEQAITQLRDIQYPQNQVREQLASVEERRDPR